MSNLRSDIQRQGDRFNQKTDALQAQMLTVSNNVARLEADITTGKVAQENLNKNGQSLANAIFTTSNAVAKIQSLAEVDHAAIITIQTNTASLSQTISFMEGELAQAPWIKR